MQVFLSSYCNILKRYVLILLAFALSYFSISFIASTYISLLLSLPVYVVLSSIYRSSLCSWLISKLFCNRFSFFSVLAFSISWKYRIRKTSFHYAVFNQFTQPNLIKATKTPGVTECERNGVRAINEWGSRSLNMVLHLHFWWS